jgi:hypothetical protein
MRFHVLQPVSSHLPLFAPGAQSASTGQSKPGGLRRLHKVSP